MFPYLCTWSQSNYESNSRVACSITDISSALRTRLHTKTCPLFGWRFTQPVGAHLRSRLPRLRDTSALRESFLPSENDFLLGAIEEGFERTNLSTWMHGS